MKRLITIAVPDDQEALEGVARWMEDWVQRWHYTPDTVRQILGAIVEGLRHPPIDWDTLQALREAAMSDLVEVKPRQCSYSRQGTVVRMRCDKDAQYLVRGPDADKHGVRYACDGHLFQTITTTLEHEGGVTVEELAEESRTEAFPDCCEVVRVVQGLIYKVINAKGSRLAITVDGKPYFVGVGKSYAVYVAQEKASE